MGAQPPRNIKLWVATVLIEVAGIIVVSGGIGVELAMHAHIGLVMITIGSLCFGTGGAIYAKFLWR